MKVLIAYYSTYGHVNKMAEAVRRRREIRSTAPKR
jgi:flavodoxin